MKIPRVTYDEVAAWPASKINAMVDRFDRLSSRNADAFIAAGRGHERPSDYMDKDDALSREARSIFSARSVLRQEIERRYGPGAPSRLLRGFGPIRT